MSALPGRLIVLEGPDGTGKSTLSKLLSEHLGNRRRCRLLAFPGNDKGSLGKHVYRLHHNPEDFDVSKINPASLQMLHIAAHLDLIEAQILPELRSGTDVILDRYWWSTVVYGHVTGVNPRAIDLMVKIELMAWEKVRPHVLFLLTRRSSANKKGRARLAEEYESLARKEKENYRVVTFDNSGELDGAVLQLAELCGD